MIDRRFNPKSGWLATFIVLILGVCFTLAPVFFESDPFSSKLGPIGTVLLFAGTITFGLSMGFKTRNSSNWFYSTSYWDQNICTISILQKTTWILHSGQICENPCKFTKVRYRVVTLAGVLWKCYFSGVLQSSQRSVIGGFMIRIWCWGISQQSLAVL